MTSEDQKNLLQLWAQGTGFVLDSTKQPKAEFARLAKVKGWVGGGQQWRLHWETCFGEPYLYWAGRTNTNVATKAGTTSKIMTTEGPGPDLVDRARRLSAASNLSSYSLVSSVSTVHSLDTDGSIDGGVIISPPADDALDTDLSALTIKDTTVSAGHDLASSSVASDVISLEYGLSTYKPGPNPPVSGVSGFWLQFVGFDPDPSATFKSEFARLAVLQNWSGKRKRQWEVEALTAEIALHYGTCMNKLDRWQQLCEDVGIEDIPGSITQCKKASFPNTQLYCNSDKTQILRPVMVNLYNLMDHCRNPDINVQRFTSYAAFCRYTRRGHAFPKDCAKQDGFIRVLLKKV